MKTTKNPAIARDRAFARQQAGIARERNAQHTKATRLVAALDRNADDYHYRRIDHATFSARNEKIWREAETDRRVAELVHELLSNR